MKRKSDLLIHPNLQGNGVYQSVNPSSANWEFLSFEARKMKLNQSWDFETIETAPLQAEQSNPTSLNFSNSLLNKDNHYF